MNRIILTLAACLISAGHAYSTDLATYKGSYEKEMDAIILEHDMKMTDLGQQYIKALGIMLETVKKAGDLDKTTAVMNESARFGKDKAMPEKPSAVLDIQQLQTSFAKQASGHDAAKVKRIVLLASKYDKVLEGVQKSLVSSSKLDDAKAVQAERNKVADSEAVVAAKKAITAVENKPHVVTQPDFPRQLKGTRVEVKVDSDENTHYGKIVKEGEYWTDGDNGKGTIRLTFKDRRFSASQKPVSVVLRIHGATSEKANSNGDVAIMCGDARVGTFKGVFKNTWNETPLDVKGLKFDSETILLSLWMSNTDGASFLSKATGKGAVLVLTY